MNKNEKCTSMSESDKKFFNLSTNWLYKYHTILIEYLHAKILDVTYMREDQSTKIFNKVKS